MQAQRRRLLHQCEAPGTDAFHRYWTCPKLDEIDDDLVRKTKNLRGMFEGEFARYPCLWGRGILPAAIIGTSKPVEAEQVRVTATPGFQDMFKSEGKAYTDGSGGPRWVPRAAAKVGSAVAAINILEQEERYLVRRSSWQCPRRRAGPQSLVPSSGLPSLQQEQPLPGQHYTWELTPSTSLTASSQGACRPCSKEPTATYGRCCSKL